MASGGSTSSAERGCAFHGSGSDFTGLELATPPPPYRSASVFSASSHSCSAPSSRGRPTRKPCRTTGEKLQTATSGLPSAANRTKDSTLSSAAPPSSQANPAGTVSCSYSAGVSR